MKKNTTQEGLCMEIRPLGGEGHSDPDDAFPCRASRIPRSPQNGELHGAPFVLPKGIGTMSLIVHPA
jgi:hypothetical protein